SFATSLEEAARGARAIFIAVGTPSLAEVGSADMRYVYDAARAIADVVDDFTVVIVKSTVPIGSGDEVEAILASRLPQERFAVVSNPEFLREGAAIEDFKHPDRVVVGVEDERARGHAGDLSADRAARRSDRLHLAPQFGDDQIRRQCVPGDEGDLHQR